MHDILIRTALASDIDANKAKSAKVRDTSIHTSQPQENLPDPNDFLAKIESLPPRYRKVMLGMAQGSTNREIARQLGITESSAAT
ncbi:response regulator transcription factor [Mobiluncus mulieris]|uniref:Response regulator transcription factor n=1 Tax=Mobiluncus mulieris TaxID=2052 RepID=A0A7Y0U106_9ACTO|nr:sigma factor-like helix-turn-helix DNA-binding protein [Mobiluncus mulieris]NMW64827.1 response regulator transcription factor [Mobiluncus mulieris]